MPSSSSGSSSPTRKFLRFHRFVPPNDPLWHDSDFAWLWSGKAVSQFGTQISLIAIPLYAAIALSASPFEMGLLSAAAGMPRLLLGFVAGAWVDRLRRKPIMVATDIGRAVVIGTIPLAAVLGMESFALLLAVEAVAGLLTVFFQAAWTSYVPGLVGRTQLTGANSKIEASNSIAQAAGPSLAGTLVGIVGGPVTLLIDGASYLASALLISRIEHTECQPSSPESRRSLVQEVKEGASVLLRSPSLRALTGSHATIILAGYIFLSIYPLYMLDILELSPRGVGFVFAAGGAGAFVGSIVTVGIMRRVGVGHTIVASAILFGGFGVTVILAALIPECALALVMFAEFAQWMMLVIFGISSGSLRQAVTPNRLLGRVAASDQVLASGMQLVGAFLGGLLGQTFGVQPALLIGVVGMFGAGAWVFWSPVRYIRSLPPHPDLDTE